MKILILGWNYNKDTDIYHDLANMLKKNRIACIVKNSALESENLCEDMGLYTNKVFHSVRHMEFDVVHCIDWRAYRAGIKLKEKLGKPLLLQVAATSFNRKKDPEEYKIEREAFSKADLMIVPTEVVRNILVKRYFVKEEKIRKVYYGLPEIHSENIQNKTVLFVADSIKDKEAEYLMDAAEEVLRYEPEVKFLVLFSGDGLPRLVDKAIQNNISKSVKYMPYSGRKDLADAVQNSSVVLVPPGTDTFGIAALFSIKNKKPVIVSRSLELSKIMKNTLKADFWKIHELAEKIISVLRYDELSYEIKTQSFEEAKELSNECFAENMLNVYREVRSK